MTSRIPSSLTDDSTRAAKVIRGFDHSDECFHKALEVTACMMDEAFFAPLHLAFAKVMHYYTAKDGGMHAGNCVRRVDALVKYRHPNGTPYHSAALFYACILADYQTDDLKFDKDTLLIGFRVSKLFQRGIVELERRHALKENRAPVDFFAPSYIRRLPLGTVGLDLSQTTQEAYNSEIREMFADLLAHGEPLHNPSDFFI